MPQVKAAGKIKHFPYSKQGMKDAIAYREEMRKKKEIKGRMKSK